MKVNCDNPPNPNPGEGRREDNPLLTPGDLSQSWLLLSPVPSKSSFSPS